MKDTSNTYNGIPEAELISGCIDGNIFYQQKLYEKFSNKMFGVCLRYSHHHHDAEDILQEGFIKVFNCLNKFRAEGSFEGWVRRIFVNTAIEFYRKTANIYTLVEVNQNLNLSEIHDDALSKININDLLKMIQTLSPGYRTIFNLYAIEGYNHKEIGELLGINEGTSKSQLARARLILQKKIIESQQYLNIDYVIGIK